MVPQVVSSDERCNGCHSLRRRSVSGADLTTGLGFAGGLLALAGVIVVNLKR